VKKILAYIFISLLLISCNKQDNPVINQNILLPYMVLTVGDVRQLQSEFDGFFYTLEIVEKTFRSDGLEVYKQLETVSFQNEIIQNESYVFITDGYFMLTSLDTVDLEWENNPYHEMKLINIYPTDGEIFLVNEGAPDSLKDAFYVQLKDSLLTKCGTFKNVAVNTMMSVAPDYERVVFYLEKLGYAGTQMVINGKPVNIRLHYLKIDEQEYGIFYPYKIGDKKKTNKLNSSFNLFK